MKREILPMIVVTLILVAFFIIILTISIENFYGSKIDRTIGEIDDVISISSGGFGHADKCIYTINNQKMILKGTICGNGQIGDLVCIQNNGFYTKCK